MTNKQSASKTSPSSKGAEAPDGELERATELLTQHLQARSVLVQQSDSPEDIASLMDAVEQFEAAVEARGGDLMVDEAPEGKKVEPDNPAFVLPTRKANEVAQAFTARIVAATRTVRG